MDTSFPTKVGKKNKYKEKKKDQEFEQERLEFELEKEKGSDAYSNLQADEGKGELFKPE